MLLAAPVMENIGAPHGLHALELRRELERGNGWTRVRSDPAAGDPRRPRRPEVETSPSARARAHAVGLVVRVIVEASSRGLISGVVRPGESAVGIDLER